jgi:S-adenosylmethionine:tRNA ribosyltransferase-isomerase
MKATDFDFFLPKDLIAERPTKEQADSKLLVLHRYGLIEHKRFSDLPLYLNKGDMLIINNTKVFPARLTGFKKNGDKIDILLIRKKDGNNAWEVLSRGRFTGRLKISEELELELHNGETANFKYSGDFMDNIWKYGNMPLPPYIRRQPDELDKKTYQTIFAKKEGSIAAPTAGLHFTDRLLNEIVSKGIIVRELTLHIGTGTFKPIRTEYIEEHSMDAECFEIEKGLISEIKKTKASGKTIISVGTTTTRALEGYMSGKWSAVNGKKHIQDTGYTIKDKNIEHHASGIMNRGSCIMHRESRIIKGYTDIFIYPGYKFKAIDSLITNFHLPGSTPLMLASALCGFGKLMNAYEEAIVRRYRFLSYGDAMLIL